SLPSKLFPACARCRRCDLGRAAQTLALRSHVRAPLLFHSRAGAIFGCVDGRAFLPRRAWVQRNPVCRPGRPCAKRTPPDRARKWRFGVDRSWMSQVHHGEFGWWSKQESCSLGRVLTLNPTISATEGAFPLLGLCPRRSLVHKIFRDRRHWPAIDAGMLAQDDNKSRPY